MILSLVVPCFNEEENVFRFFKETENAFSGRKEKLEYVFVDDGSSDATFPNLKKIFEENPCAGIQIISFSRNFGKEAAIYAGLKNATGDFVCVIDADLQQRPETVIKMLDELESDASLDCVAAFQDDRRESRLLSFFKSCFYKTINRLSDVEFVNGASDFRLMRRNMVEAVLSLKEYNRFSKGIFSFVGFSTKYIPYEAQKRENGKSKWSFIKLMRYALDGIIAFSTKPLKFASYAGVLSFIAAIVCALFALSPGAEAYSDTVFLVSLFVLGGIILISLGIHGAYLAKAYTEIKNRPVYIVKTHIERKENGKD